MNNDSDNNIVNVVNKFTLDNIKNIKENTPVNENNVMELTSAYIDEAELNTALIPYATKVYVDSDINPLNISVNKLENAINNHTHSEFDELTVNKLNGYTFLSSAGGTGNIKFTTPVIPTIKEDSVMEIGKYIDFHTDGEYDNDYTIRLTADPDELIISKSINTQGKSNSFGSLQLNESAGRIMNYLGIYEYRFQTFHTDYLSYRKRWVTFGSCGDYIRCCPETDYYAEPNFNKYVFKVDQYGNVYCNDIVSPVFDKYLTKEDVVNEIKESNELVLSNYLTKEDAANEYVSNKEVSNIYTLHNNDISTIQSDISTIQSDMTAMNTKFIDRVSANNTFASISHTHANFDSLTIESVNIIDSTIRNANVTNINGNIINDSTNRIQFPSIPTVQCNEIGTTMYIGNSIGLCTNIMYMNDGTTGYANTDNAIVITGSNINGTNILTIDAGITVKSIVCDSILCHGKITEIPDIVVSNTTITHNAPVNEPITSFQIGMPVFTTGMIYHYDRDTKKYVNGSNSPTDCIPSVKSSGSYRQYLGICVAIYDNNSIDFATHGDYYFRVNDTAQYEVGDIVLFDGNKLDDDLLITAKISQSIVGKVTGIIDEHLLCIFKD